MAVSTYNYSDNSLFGIKIQAASKKFAVDSAADGGSVLADIADKDVLPNGEEFFFKSDVCCFVTADRVAFPKIRVVWNVVYDLPRFRRVDKPSYDERLERDAAPGTAWCTAIIEPRGVMDKQTNKLALHFLQDGTVIGVVGSDAIDRPLDTEEIASHSARIKGGKFCNAEIANPWFGQPPKKHME